MKRILSVILALCMVTSFLPATVFAASTVASGTCGDNLTWTLDNAGTLTISGAGAMDDYIDPSDFVPWYTYSHNGNISSVIIEYGVTTIGASAFFDCQALASISIPDSVTHIGQDAFSGCQGLTNISIPHTVTNIGPSAFSSSGLTRITIPSSIAAIGSNAFTWCYNLSEVYFCGDAPSLNQQIFDGVTATAYYPAENTTWTSNVMLDFGGDITWVAYTPEEKEYRLIVTPENAYWEVEVGQSIKITYSLYYGDDPVSDWEQPYASMSSTLDYSSARICGWEKAGCNWVLTLEGIKDGGFFLYAKDISSGAYNEIYVAVVPESPADYRLTVSPESEKLTMELGQSLQIRCELYYGDDQITEWEQPQISIGHSEGNPPVSYDGWEKQWNSYTLNLDGVSPGTAYVTIFDATSETSLNITVEVLPLDETAFDDPSKAEWVTEHIIYAHSEAYRKQVVDDFPGELKNVFEEIKGDGTIGSYDALKTINKILGFDFDKLSETQEYELLLTQILFSFNGVASIEETYDEYLSESAVDIIKIVLDIDEFVAGLDDDKLTQIKQTLESLDNLANRSDEFKETLSSLLSQIDFSEKDFPKLCFNELAEKGISFMAGLTASQLETYCNTSSECVMYLAAGEAYTKTSEAFGQMLLDMRSHLAVLSDLVNLQEPLIGGEAILAMLDREVSKGVVVSNPFDIPVSITELCWAIENIYTGLEDYKETGGKAIAQKASDQYVQGTIYNVFSTGADVVISFLECVPAVKAFDTIRKLFDGTQFIIDTFTNIDDKAYHGTMVMRLYILAKLHYISLNGLAEGTEYWGIVNSIGGQVLDRNKQYDDAVRFDEAVSLYRAILSVALEYAKEYCSAPLFESPRTYQGYLQPLSIQESKLVRQLAETKYEWCHTIYSEYAEENNLIVLPADTLAVYGLKCPISVTVTDDVGSVIARITDDMSEIMSGYEQYFYVEETYAGSGEYLKVITVPKTYNVSFEGTSSGELDAVVVDLQTNNSKFFIDIPISANTEGKFIDGSQNKELTVDSIHHTGDNDIHVHKYSSPDFTWYDDYSCKATFTCGDNDDTQEIDCIVVSESVYTAGAVRITYTAIAKFKGQIYETTKTEEQMGVIRIAGADRIATSLMLADQLKETLGVETFDSIIVASALNFPDALTGSYLAAVKSAPILLTYPAAHEQTCAYIETTLTSGGTVYILGGTGAVSADFENLLIAKGIPSKRVAGSDRFGTNLAILAEAGISADQPILIATATGFADSLSASATGKPMLLVYGKLTDAQKTFLETTSKEFIIIGGDAAVSAALEAELDVIGDVERVAGESRYQTSVKVAEKFIQAPEAAILAYARNFPDGLCGGPLAYALGAPLILTDNVDPSAADAYVEGLKSGIVVGGGGLISDTSAREIFDLAADAEISVK